MLLSLSPIAFSFVSRLCFPSPCGVSCEDCMESSDIGLISAVVRPFLLLVVVVCIVYPLRKAFERFVPEGRWKRILLRRIN